MKKILLLLLCVPLIGFGQVPGCTWLGTGRVADNLKEYISYNEAKKIVHSLKIRNWREWKVYFKSGKKPNDIPNAPAGVYKDKGWISAADWFGKE